MKAGVYADGKAILCHACNERTGTLCSDCHAPICEKHSQEGRCGACKKSLESCHVAVNETPLWWDLLFFDFQIGTGALVWKVLRRVQYNKFQNPNPRDLIQRGMMIEDVPENTLDPKSKRTFIRFHNIFDEKGRHVGYTCGSYAIVN